MNFFSDTYRNNYPNYVFGRKNGNSNTDICSKIKDCFSNVKSRIKTFIKTHPYIFGGIILGLVILIIIIIVAVVASKSKEESEYYFNISEKSKQEVMKIYNSIGTNDDTTLTNFCNYLSSKASKLTEEQKVYLAHYWITKNIKYDNQGLASNTVKYNPDDFFYSRKTVCTGYARLFRRLLVSMNYDDKKIKNIQGYAKGAGYSVYTEPVSNHEWNAVNIKGHWCLLDTTWDVDNDQFYYLCTPPSCFVRDHLPDNNEDQFLKKPLSLQSFHNKVWTNGQFCYFKGEVIEDKSIYNVCGRGKFKVKYKVDFDTQLLINKNDKVSFKITPIDNGFQVDFYVNEAGNFELSMFLLNYDLNPEFIGRMNIKCNKAPKEKYYFN